MNTFNIGHLLAEICIDFTLDNVLQFRLRNRDCKYVAVFSPYSSLWLTYFPVPKMFKAQWDRDRTMGTIMEISAVLPYCEN